ncbi:conserved protein of unknown function [Cupriavidus neocaledonicus]|uniref:Uncharacterized protein n=1 Tax=Cupriavidus neocaledonicus TaxID=1040979 RepID=A0A375H468_9BURK|nr:hypothetical protein CBM2605_A70073 [Cupriavidus neocaledonicus]SPD46045.1 conserved protein of unknown function [Cupriavidus neocaledonicus]
MTKVNDQAAGVLPSPTQWERAGVRAGIYDEVSAVAIASARPHPLPLSRKRERGENQQ